MYVCDVVEMKITRRIFINIVMFGAALDCERQEKGMCVHM